MKSRVLSSFEREKQDNNNDSEFYKYPRFVYHLDSSFRSKLTNYYREIIQPNSTILDLMSSWVSHLPKDVKYKEVIGHGLNRQELIANQQLNRHWIQDLNRSQELPLGKDTIDFILIVAGWQYLQEPENIAEELYRISKPNGILIISFSNRAFWNKCPNIWLNGTYKEHFEYINSILIGAGWENIRNTAESSKGLYPFNIIGIKGDPFFCVTANKSY